MTVVEGEIAPKAYDNELVLLELLLLESENEEVKGVTAELGDLAIEGAVSDDADEYSGPEYETSSLKSGVNTDDLVRVYLNDIYRTPLLTAEQELELAKRFEIGSLAEIQLDHIEEEGIGAHDAVRFGTVDELQILYDDGQAARNHMLEANQRLVVSIAKKYRGKDMDFLDLIQEGNLGLIKAIEHYDYSKGYRLSTTATVWIWQEITRALANQSRTIRVPVYMVENINKINKAERELRADLRRPATLEELADELDMTPDAVRECQAHRLEMLSLEVPVGKESKEDEFGDQISDIYDIPTDHIAIFREGAEFVQDLLNSIVITAQQKRALELRFGLKDGVFRSHEATALIMGISKNRVGQLQKAVIEKILKHYSLLNVEKLIKV